MNEQPDQEPSDLEDQPRRALDPRAKLLANLTQQQRYVLYALVTLGVIIVLFIEISTR